MTFDGDLSNWTYVIDEISNGLFQIIATDTYGRRIDLSGFDPEKLISECRAAAKDMNLQISKE